LSSSEYCLKFKKIFQLLMGVEGYSQVVQFM
jgi:hypothetical protein